ncbi:MAG TPA: response regulator transcription factor [Anaerolineales bacterium]|nr:response regulator transcription factor [Anaerolineales bacterium]
MKKQSLTNIQGKRILICDDESRTRDALKALLLAREMTQDAAASPAIQVVGEARDGEEAIRLTDIYQPEVVVIDACMPGMSGLEVTRLIKNKWPSVKVVMLTMYSNQRQAALDAGVDIFLNKGCLAENLFDAILS